MYENMRDSSPISNNLNSSLQEFWLKTKKKPVSFQTSLKFFNHENACVNKMENMFVVCIISSRKLLKIKKFLEVPDKDKNYDPALDAFNNNNFFHYLLIPGKAFYRLINKGT